MPHDGLFIRRNSAFGTRQVIGIQDLIDQGVQLDQGVIRFDDFIDQSSSGVPVPEPGRGVAMSYGISPIPPEQQRDARATHYLEIAVRAAERAPEEQLARIAPSVNYVFVIDRSGSMDGSKLESVKLSLRELLGQMRPDDFLGIVAFNDSPLTVMKATRASELDEDALSKILSRLDADGGTDINIGLLYGVDEINRHRRNTYANRLYLLSDGQPTSGERDWLRIRRNFVDKAPLDVALSTMAFGTDANERELETLAGVAGGTYAFVSDSSEVGLQAADDLARRDLLTAINVQLRLQLDPDVVPLHFYGHDLVTDPRTRAKVRRDVELAKTEAREKLGLEAPPDLITQEKGIRLAVPDLAVGETYVVALEVQVPPERPNPVLGSVAVQYSDTFTHTNELREVALGAPGQLAPDLVAMHALQLWTSEVVFWALDDLYQREADTAKRRIERHVAVLDHVEPPEVEKKIVDDRVHLNKFVSLMGNLGLTRSMTESYQAQAVAVHQLRSFGQSRNGFMTAGYWADSR